MKTFWGTFLAVLAISISPALASTSVSFDPDGVVVTNVAKATGSLDWNVGNALAIGGNNSIAAFALGIPGVKMQTVYQASLAAINDPNGVNITPANLNSGFELTTVAAFQEVVSGLLGVPGTLGSTALLSVVPGGDNYFEIYYSPVVNANNLAGTGFNDGTLILRGTVYTGFSNFTQTSTGSVGNLDQFNADNYPAIDSISGQGNTTISALITMVDATFFPTLMLGDKISVDFATTLNDPFKQVDPSGKFIWSNGGPALTSAMGVAPIVLGAGKGGVGVVGGPMGSGLGTVNGKIGGGAGPDFQIQADATSSFSQVPEPISVLAWSSLAGVFGLITRRKK